MVKRIYNWVANDIIRANQLLAVMRFATAFIIGVLLVKSYLTDAQVGQFEYLLFLAINFSYFITNAFSNLTYSFIPKKDDEDQEKALGELVGLNIYLGIIFSIIVYFLLPSFLNLIERPDVLEYRFWLTLLTFTLTSGNWAESTFLVFNKSRALVSFTMIIYTLKLVIIGYGIYSQWDILELLKLYLLWEAIKMFWGFFLVKNIQFNIPNQKLKMLLWLLFPLLIHFLLNKFLDFINGNIVVYYFSDADFAYYQYGAREMPLTSIMIGSLSSAMIPLLAKDVNKNVKLLRERLKNYIPILSIISLILMALSPFLFIKFYNDAFILSALIFNILTLVLLSRLVMPHSIIYAKGDNYLFVWISLAEVLMQVVLAIWFVNTIGILGIPIAFLCTMFFYSIVGVIIVQKKYQIPLKDYLPIRTYVVWMSILVIGFFIIKMFLF